MAYCHNMTASDQEKILQKGFMLQLKRIKSRFSEINIEKSRPSIEIVKIYKPYLEISSRIIPDETVILILFI